MQLLVTSSSQCVLVSPVNDSRRKPERAVEHEILELAESGCDSTQLSRLTFFGLVSPKLPLPHLLDLGAGGRRDRRCPAFQAINKPESPGQVNAD